MTVLLVVALMIGIPAAIAGLWLLVTTLLGALSGWPGLSRRYPDRPEPPIGQFRSVSGTMGAGVNMRNVLRLDVCASGLRLGMSKLLGPGLRDIFVPWTDIEVAPKTEFMWQGSELRFGRPAAGRLVISADLAEQLAQRAGAAWPGPRD